MDGLGAVETVEAGGGEDESVAGAFGEFAEAGVDVAAELDEFEVGAQGEELGPAARAGGADAASHGKRVERPVWLADPGVACVGAGWDGGQDEARVEFRGEIFEGVDGEVDAAFGEGLLNFLDEDPFAAGKRGRGMAGRCYRVRRIRGAACGRRWCE